MFTRNEPGRNHRVAALRFEEDVFSLAVGRTRDGVLARLDFIEESRSAGLRGGAVSDAGAFADALDRLVQTLEDLTRNEELHRIVCGVHGRYLHIELLQHEFLPLDSEPMEMAQIEMAMFAAAERGGEDRALLQVMPWRYLLEGQRETANPEGLRARSLTIEALGIYAERSVFASYQDVFRELGLSGAELMPTSLAGSRFALTPDERGDGVVLLEFAWEDARISVYSRGRLYCYDSIDTGLEVLAEEMNRREPMTPAEALNRMRTLSLRDPDDRQLAEAVYGWLDTCLGSAVRVLRDALVAMERPPAVMSWVLAGPLAGVRGLDEVVAGKVGAPVRVARPPEGYRIAAHDDSTTCGLLGLLASAAGDPPAGSARRTGSGLVRQLRRAVRRLGAGRAEVGGSAEMGS